MPFNYVPHRKQIAAHLAFLTGGYKRGVLFFGRQTGKTYFSTQHAWLSAVVKQGRYGIVFKTYKQAHEVVWRQYVPLIPKELVFKKNEQDLIIELNYVKGPVTLPDGTKLEIEHDQDKPRSTIQLLGSDQADSHRGFKMDGLIFDEYADQDPNNWDAVYKHFFTTTNGWAIFMGTPRGYNHFYDLNQFAQEDDRWFYLKATWRDSPYVSRQFIEEERAEATKKGTLSTFLQEVELEFRAVQGAVYPAFNRDIHVVKPSQIPDLGELTIYAGIDFGYHTTACLFVGIDRDQNWWVFDEVYGREDILQDIMPRIWEKLGDQRLTLMVGDSQAKDAIETMVTKGFPIVPVIKRTDSIIHGIDLIRTMLKPRIQLVGEPKPTLFFSSTCRNVIKEMEAYKYPEDKPDRNPDETPQKEDDHGPDALRYLKLHLKYGLEKDDKLPKSSLVKQFNEYGI
jgi:phage terminase large subunit